MSNRRFLGAVLIGVGVAITIGAGILLAVPTASEALLLPAVGVFLVVMPLILIGVYWLLAENNVLEMPDNEMEKPLALFDALRNEGRTSLATLAESQGISAREAEILLQELVKLRIFTGYWQPQGVIEVVERSVLTALSACVVCHSPLVIQTVETTCTHCQTRYFLSDNG